MPEILRAAAIIWVAGVASAALRGVNTHDPLEIARRLAMVAGLSVLLVVAMGLAIQLLVFLCGSAAGKSRKKA